MKKILIIYNDIPAPPTNGGNLRVYYLFKELSKYYNVTLLTAPAAKHYHHQFKKLTKFGKVLVVPYFVEDYANKSLSELIIHFIQSLFFKLERIFLPFRSKLIRMHTYQILCLRKEIKKLSKKHFDYIQVEHFYLGNVIKGLKTNAKKILDFHNVHSFTKANLLERYLLRKEEKEMRRPYDLAICCSEIEKKRLASLGYDKIIVVPNGAEKIHTQTINKKSPTSLLFVGELYYRPNYEGIKYFFKKIYPLLDKKIQINIVGRFNKLKFRKERKLRNVRFHGFVKEIEQYFNNAIFICPLLEGGGTRIKILTAFAAGVPVVSTSKGAEGIDYKSDENILIADSPTMFRDCIYKLLNEHKVYKKIQYNARELVEAKYSWKDIAKDYYQELENII